MKIDDLLLLAQVHKAGSLSAASRLLDCPKATLSRRLTALETSVGARLFVPGASRLTLTELGEQLAERAARHDEDIAETRQWLASREATPQGRLRVSVPAEFAMLVLAESFSRFVRRYPKVELEIDTSPRRVDLFNEPYDVAVRMGPVDEPELIARQYMLLERGLYASPVYLQARPAPQTPADLAEHDFVVLSQARDASKRRLQNGALTAEIDLRGPLEANSIGVVLSLTRAGGGIGSFPFGMVASDVEAGMLVPVLPGWSYEPLPVYLLTASRRLMPAKTRAFIDHLFETVPEWARTALLSLPAKSAAPPRRAP
ncbi:LysR family transcriptional regulator [Roseateles saccharophilus]|uniref:DNA-binding transcriptional LysR family regulator n=1 Tax=Roseateles saccharophilus TaxID=304 RepID=A0A4R3V966_ROSSA|nr:LysR family transcriptional regulator [Roseateles saccharophilus]MDG0835319.1 LysR family transcriptional regulator [Roseateles saccharophilus]TCV00253.1 DNA-binding transcriptional LysR family regulator [Roseateles saccharophilus]